jgi:hypothetical protein
MHHVWFGGPRSASAGRPQQVRRGPGLGRSHLAECERGNAARLLAGTPWMPGRTGALLLANLGSERRRPASPASLLARVCRAGANSSACCATVAARRGGRASPGHSTHHSRTRLVRRLQRQHLDGQGRSRRALLRPAKRASPRRGRPACSRSSDSGVFSASAPMPAPRAKRGRAGHDVTARLAATGLSTVVLKPVLSLAVRYAFSRTSS